MRDRRLETNIKRVEDFIEQWKRLSQFLDRGLKGGTFTDEEEAGFLDLKSAIAQQHELLITTLGTESERDDKALRLLNSVPSLQSFQGLAEGMDKRISSEWHSTYLALQSLLGRLKGRKAQLASISSFRVGMRGVFGNPLVVVFVAVAAAYGVYKFTYEMIPVIQKAVEQGDKK